MEKQKTVDSLIERLLPFIDRSKISDTALQNIVEEHLSMEKEQIVEAYKAKFGGGTDPKWKALRQEQAEQYYNETYGK